MGKCEFCSGDAPIFDSRLKMPLKRNLYTCIKNSDAKMKDLGQITNLVNMCMGSVIEVELKINYCPMCGRNLTERDAE